MLRFFRRNHVVNSLLLFPYALFLRMIALWVEDARIPGQLQGAWGESWIAAVQQWGAGELLLSTFLVFIQATLINRLSIRHNLMGEISLLPGAMYVLLTAMHPAFLGLSSWLVAHTTLIIAFQFLFDAIKKERSEENKFLMGWWLGVTGLLFTPYLLLGLFGLVGMSVLKTVKIKDAFQYATGFVTPLFIGWMVRIIAEGELVFHDSELFAYFGIPEWARVETQADLITVAVIGIILLFSLLGYSQMVARKNIHAQKKIDTLYTYLLFCIPMALFLQTLTIAYLLVLTLPLALFLAVMLRQIRLPAIAESIHFILMVVAWLTQVFLLM